MRPPWVRLFLFEAVGIGREPHSFKKCHCFAVFLLENQKFETIPARITLCLWENYWLYENADRGEDEISRCPK